VKENKKLKWNRSKIILLGKGRVGKTALADNIQNKDFQPNSASTRGGEKYDLKSDFQGSDGSLIAGKFIKYGGGKDVTTDAMISAANRNGSSKNRRNNGEEYKSDAGSDQQYDGYQDFQYNRSDITETSSQERTNYSDGAESSKLKNYDSDPHIKKTRRVQSDQYEDANISSDEVDINLGQSSDDGFGHLLSDNVSRNTKLIISLYDFGGQEMFHVFHPLFMSRNAVYFLVFDLSDLLSIDCAKSESCLLDIRLWLNTITLQTLQRYGEKKKVVNVSPIALVGCKAGDLVKDENALRKASKMLKATFSNHVAWNFVLKFNYGPSQRGKCLTLSCFPIDNKNRDDLSIRSLSLLLSVAEMKIEEFKCIKEEVHLSWFLTTDAILKERQNSSFMQYSKVCELAKSHGVEVMSVDKCAEVDSLLEFLSDSGILLWINDLNSGLREVVILDPTEYFIKSATRIICKHLPTINPVSLEKDATVHSSSPFYQRCRDKYSEDWYRMLEYGFASVGLTRELLLTEDEDEHDRPSHCRNEDHFLIVLSLLKRYGLVLSCEIPAALRINENENSNTEVLFFPSLSPINPKYYDIPEENDESDDENGTNDEQSILSKMKTSLTSKYNWIREEFKSVATFYFAFTFSDEIINVKLLSMKDVSDHGFLPNGLFVRFICGLFVCFTTA
jgi:GTPase SAR1 family protein